MLTSYGCKRNNWYDWKTQNEVFMKNNLISHPDIQVSSTGLQYRILADPNPTEQRPFAACVVNIDYQTKLINGQQVDAAKSAYFLASQLVAGVQEGLHLIHVHGDIELWIPYNLAYGEDGNGTEGYKAFVPPYSAIYMKIHINSSSAN